MDNQDQLNTSSNENLGQARDQIFRNTQGKLSEQQVTSFVEQNLEIKNSEIRELEEVKNVEEEKIGEKKKKSKVKVLLIVLIALGLILMAIIMVKAKLDKKEIIQNEGENQQERAESRKNDEAILKYAQESAKRESQELEVVENKEFSKEVIEGVEEGEIVFESEGLLWVYETKTGEIESLEIEGLEKQERNDRQANLPSGLSFSKEGKYLFFSQRKDGKDYVYIYDFSEKKLVNKIESCVNANIGWVEENYRYLIVDCGTSPGVRGRVIYDFTTDEKLHEFGGMGIEITNRGILASKMAKDLWALPYGPTPVTSSIYLIDDSNFTERLLLEGNYQISYGLVEDLGDGNFVYRKVSYSEEFPAEGTITDEEVNKEEFRNKWEEIYNNSTEEYYRYNLASGQSEKLDNYAREKIENKCSYGESCSPSQAWKAGVEGEWPNRKIVITKIDGEIKKEISYGNSVVWRRGS